LTGDRHDCAGSCCPLPTGLDGRQADNDLSIPDQRRQARAYCASRGWEIVADYVEPGVSATDDRRPGFQRMIDAATTKPPTFDVIVVHSFSRLFRDQFQLEFCVRRLAKNGVRLVSITHNLGSVSKPQPYDQQRQQRDFRYRRGIESHLGK
jgi:DNA invertase Pin-like site-specific DNA recombinase